MITILHGDNQVKTREHLTSAIQQFKLKGGQEVIHLNGKKITQTDLIQATETASLFGSDKLVIIEQLFSRPQSQQKKDLFIYLDTISKDLNLPAIIIWEDQLITPAKLKFLKNSSNHSFKLPQQLFSFLESIKPGNNTSLQKLFIQLSQHEAIEMIFVMVIRQIRLLIMAKDKALLLSPWQQQKLTSQANYFNLDQLLKLHKELLQIDTNNKTGKNLLTLQQSLDIFLAKI